MCSDPGLCKTACSPGLCRWTLWSTSCGRLTWSAFTRVMQLPLVCLNFHKYNLWFKFLHVLRSIKMGENCMVLGESKRPGSDDAQLYASCKFTSFRGLKIDGMQTTSPSVSTSVLWASRKKVVQHVVVIDCHRFFSSQDKGPCPRTFSSCLPRQRRAWNHFICIR